MVDAKAKDCGCREKEEEKRESAGELKVYGMLRQRKWWQTQLPMEGNDDGTRSQRRLGWRSLSHGERGVGPERQSQSTDYVRD